MNDQPTTEATDGTNYNVEVVNVSIQDTCREMLRIDRQIAALKEKYIKPLQDEKNKVKQDFKNDTGIRLKVLSVRYAEFKLQEEAKQFLDEEEGQRVLDEMKTMYRGMQVGGMIDMIDVIDHVSNKEQAQADDTATDEAA